MVPSGPYTVVDFHYAGGVMNVMKMLESKLFTDAPSMYGGTWKELLSKVTPKENEVIHSLERPLFHEPGLKILRGNLSPNGAIVRPTAVYEEVKYLKGKAKYSKATVRHLRQSRQEKSYRVTSLSFVMKDVKGSWHEGTDAEYRCLIGLGLHKSVG